MIMPLVESLIYHASPQISNTQHIMEHYIAPPPPSEIYLLETFNKELLAPLNIWAVICRPLYNGPQRGKRFSYLT